MTKKTGAKIVRIKRKKGGKKLMLHIGCGEKYIPGFMHIDVRPLSHIDHVASADDLGFLGDNTADLIYCPHILEHFPRTKILAVLSEWHRVLKPKGILRIAVPDFEALAEIYLEIRDIDLVLGPLVGRQDYPENTHFMVFDYKSLDTILKKAGFRNVHRYDWWKTIHKNYDDYSQAYIPHMDKKHGRLISLNVECKK